MRIVFGRKFKKQYAKLSPKLQNQCDERLRLFMVDKYHPRLRLHPLKGEFLGCFSMDITGDFRIVFEAQSNDVVLLIAIGTHSELYG